MSTFSLASSSVFPLIRSINIAVDADEIAQQEEDIINSQSSCAEIVSVDTKEEPVGSEQAIPAEIVKRVINTESW